MPPSKAERKRYSAIIDTFHSHFESSPYWTAERWRESLYPALEKPAHYVAMVNGFVPTSSVKRVFEEASSDFKDLKVLELPSLSGVVHDINQPLCFDRARRGDDTNDSANNLPFPPPQFIQCPVNGQKLLSHWNLDAASVLAAHMLNVQPGNKVLDLCAAPGGKSITLAQALWPDIGSDQNVDAIRTARGCLHSNEFHAERSHRLARNLRAYLPRELLDNGQVKILQLDGTSALDSLPLQPGYYDRVLVDAPCSSERHLIHSHVKSNLAGRFSDDMLSWRAGASKTLARTQVGLLLTALKCVRIGGRVVYATCSLEVAENDGVVERATSLLEKQRKNESFSWTIQFEHGKKASSVDSNVLGDLTEVTEYGRIILPDRLPDFGSGPIFFSVITKTSTQAGME